MAGPAPSRAAQTAVVQSLESKDLPRAIELASALTRAYPHHAFGWHCWGVALELSDAFESALPLMLRALELNPKDAQCWGNLAKLYKDLARFDDAIAASTQSLQLQPNDLLVWQRHLYLLNHVDSDTAFDRQALKEYGERMAQHFVSPYRFDRPYGHAVLRVGLVSGDFRHHPVALFLQDVLSALVKLPVDLRIYNNNPYRDDMTERLASIVRQGPAGEGAWVDIHALNHTQAADRVHQDQVDVLLDLAGFTAANRIELFALRPAPLQGSWLGYFGTTGLQTMDFVLADPHSVPPALQARFSERVAYLPHTRLCYGHDGLRQAPALSPLPALSKGHMTIGCFQNLSKVTPAVMALWGRILKASPSTHLRIQSRQLGNAAAQAAALARLQAAGIDTQQVHLHAKAAWTEYLSAHDEVDLIIDTFPFPGGTTTCEALYMGVPTLTLAKPSMIGRQGASLLINAGLAQWVCHDEDALIERAVHWLGKPEALATLRQGLRAQVQASPLFDSPGFAADWLHALQDLHRERWASERAASPAGARSAGPDYDSQLALAQQLSQGETAHVIATATAWTQQFPQHAMGWKFLSAALEHCGEVERALPLAQRVVALSPQDAEAWGNLGKIHKDLGELELALHAYEHALQLQPDNLLVRQRHLYLLNHLSGKQAGQSLAYAQAYGQALQAEHPVRFAHPPRAANQPLRVGLVSGDFCYHPVGLFLHHVLQALRDLPVRTTLYCNTPRRDAMSQHLADAVHAHGAWVDIRKLDDRQAAERIAADQLDVLLDLSGHTAGNRLGVFAQRPTRLQGSWLGYFGSTGVPTMDFVLSDAASTPPAAAARFTEALVRLPHTRLCYGHAGLSLAPEVAPLPALRNGYMTVGCFQNLSKVTPAVLHLWSRVLQASPTTQLRFQSKQLKSPAVRLAWLERLRLAGIAQERVQLHGPSNLSDYFAAHHEVDMVLDTFPFPGGTTTCEALWMGVPTLSLVSDSMIGRQGQSLLGAAGLSDWVCHDEATYLAQALARLSDTSSLASLRQGLRRQMRQSPLFDAPRFALDWLATLQRTVTEYALTTVRASAQPTPQTPKPTSD
jgi:predicted O-linked N-acetylglucosamine transferase (SPINDLY family)